MNEILQIATLNCEWQCQCQNWRSLFLAHGDCVSDGATHEQQYCAVVTWKLLWTELSGLAEKKPVLRCSPGLAAVSRARVRCGKGKSLMPRSPARWMMSPPPDPAPAPATPVPASASGPGRALAVPSSPATNTHTCNKIFLSEL